MTGTQKETPLVIGDKTYQLVYDFNTMCDVEEESGVNLLTTLQNLGGMTAEQLRALLYASLKLSNPTTTLLEAGSLIRVDRIYLITTALAEMYFEKIKTEVEALRAEKD